MSVLFTPIFDSSPFYAARNLVHSFYNIQYYDISDYVAANRFTKSPPYTMMFWKKKR